MTSDQNKAASKHLLELWGDNALHQPANFLSNDYVNHQHPDAGGGTSSLTLEAWKGLVSDFHGAFSDVRMEVLLQVAEGDLVCSRWRMTAKHTGSFRGGPAATGRTTTWTGVHTDRYEAGKLVESWVDWDKASFLEGLGITA